SKLDLPSASGKVLSPYFSRRLPECTRVGGQISGLGELGAVEQVVSLPAKFQVGALGEVELFLQHYVPIVCAWAVKVVAAYMTGAAGRSIGEETRWCGRAARPKVWPSLCSRIADDRRFAVWIKVRPLRLTSMGSVRGGEEVKWKAAGEGSNGSEFPAPEYSTGKTSWEMGVSVAQRDRPGIVQYQPLSHVQVGTAVFGSQVERVAREFVSAERRS